MKPALLTLALAVGLASGGNVLAQAAPAAQPSRVVAGSDPTPPPWLADTVSLAPRQLAQLVATRNAEIRYSRLGADVAGYLSQAEASLYEAVLFGSVRGEERLRQRSVEERIASIPGLAVLDERVGTAEAGVRQRLPSAGEVSLSYRIVRRANNIIESSTSGAQDTEWTAGLVLTLKQPLLRSAGMDVLETDKRIAELERQVQWTQFRQQLLKSTADSLSLYWQLYRAQQTRELREASAANVRKMASDVDARVEAGRSPPVSRVEMHSTLVQREAEVTRSDQAAREAESRLMTTLALAPAVNKGLHFRALDMPLPTLASLESSDKALESALAQWPPFQLSQLRLEQARLRLAFALNQTRPQLDFTASYNGTGLSYYRVEARRLAGNDKYPEWTVGFNFEMPLLGNRRADGQYQAQAVRVSQSELELDTIRMSLANDLVQKRDELEAALKLAEQMKKDLVLRQTLLDSERDRYQMGVGLLRQWLERENDVVDTRQRLLEAVMRAHQSYVAWKFAQGSLLDEYDIALRTE